MAIALSAALMLSSSGASSYAAVAKMSVLGQSLWVEFGGENPTITASGASAAVRRAPPTTVAWQRARRECVRGAAAQHAIAARETCHQSPCGARDAAVRNPSRRRRCFRRQPACPGRAQRPAWTPQQQSSRRWSPRDGTASLPLRIAAASNRGRSPQSGARQALPNEVKWRRARITKRERAQKRKRFGPRAAPSAPIRAPLSSFWPLYNVFVPWIHERRAGRRASRPRCSARGSEREVLSDEY